MRVIGRFLQGGLMASLSGILIAACWPAAAGTPILIQNFSFETPPQTPSTDYFSGYSTDGTIPGWSTDIAFKGAGVWYPANSALFFTVPVPDGNQVAYLANSNAAQQLTSTVQPGKYTLSAAFGHRVDGLVAPSTLELWAGGTVSNGNIIGGTLLASTAVDTVNAVTPGQFRTFFTSATIGPHSGLIGQTLNIRVTDPFGQQVDFDNVKLNLSAVPEAGTLLCFSGLLAISSLTLLRRRK